MPPPLPTETVRARLAAILPDLKDRYGVRSLSIFGSYARGEQTAESDLDVLVDFERTPGMLTFIGLAHLLEARTGLPIDLATRPMIGPQIVLDIQADLVAV